MNSVKHYRTKDGRHLFTFRFAQVSDYIEIHCLAHPHLNGQDSSVLKTHLYDSGLVCIVAGKEPREPRRAEQLASQWAEYFVEYARTGIAQS